MIKDVVSGLASPVEKIVTDLADNRIQKGEAVARLTAAIQEAASDAEQAAAGVIIAEATGEGWYQRAWRPVGAIALVSTLVAFPVLYLFGYDVRPLAEALNVVPDRLYWLVAGCFGGYTALRSFVDKGQKVPGLDALITIMRKRKKGKG